jgi:hypothetical protein
MYILEERRFGEAPSCASTNCSAICSGIRQSGITITPVRQTEIWFSPTASYLRNPLKSDGFNTEAMERRGSAGQ